MKKKLVIMISGVIISIAIVTLIILYFCTDTFKSPEELFWTFAKQNNKILSIICNENAKVQKEIKEKNVTEGIIEQLKKVLEKSNELELLQDDLKKYPAWIREIVINILKMIK